MMVCFCCGERERERIVQFYQKSAGRFSLLFHEGKIHKGHIRYGSAFWMELDFGRVFFIVVAAITGQLRWSWGSNGTHIGCGGRLGLFWSVCLLVFSFQLGLEALGPCKLGWHLLRIHTEGVKLSRLLIPAFTVFGSAMNCTEL